MLDGEVTICCTHGETTSYPVAAIKITIGGKDIMTTTGISSTLPASALLDWDIPELLRFVDETWEACMGDLENAQRTIDAMTAIPATIHSVKDTKS